MNYVKNKKTDRKVQFKSANLITVVWMMLGLEVVKSHL